MGYPTSRSGKPFLSRSCGQKLKTPIWFIGAILKGSQKSSKMYIIVKSWSKPGKTTFFENMMEIWEIKYIQRASIALPKRMISIQNTPGYVGLIIGDFIHFIFSQPVGSHRATGGALTTLNLDCESHRSDRDKLWKPKNWASESTSSPSYVTFPILRKHPLEAKI